MSRATDEISWESHRDFYAKAVADSERALLIACVNAIPAAMLRFDLGDAGAEISINLNPAMRGKGLARSILQAGCAYGFGSLGLDKMHAEIKPENARSVRIFEGVGFVRQSQGAGTHLYVLDGPGL
jgi:RimJ/RimL family protein N-acetyltransferase